MSLKLRELRLITSSILKSQQRRERIASTNPSAQENNDDAISIMSTSSFLSRKSFTPSLNKVLRAKYVYRGFIGRKSILSLQTSESRCSIFSQLSQVSKIAVVNLPIYIRHLPLRFLPVSSALYDINYASEKTNVEKSAASTKCIPRNTSIERFVEFTAKA